MRHKTRDWLQVRAIQVRNGMDEFQLAFGVVRFEPFGQRTLKAKLGRKFLQCNGTSALHHLQVMHK